MHSRNQRQDSFAQNSDEELGSPTNGRSVQSSLPQECLTALGALYSPEPLRFSDLALLVNDSNSLRAIGDRIQSQVITPRIDSFPKSDTFAYRGMMLTPTELEEIVHSGIQLSKISAAGRGKINFGIVLDVPVLAAFDVFQYVDRRDDVLAVVIIAKQSDIPDFRIRYSLLETREDVPSSAIVHTLVFDPGKNAFRELL